MPRQCSSAATGEQIDIHPALRQSFCGKNVTGAAASSIAREIPSSSNLGGPRRCRARRCDIPLHFASANVCIISLNIDKVNVISVFIALPQHVEGTRHLNPGAKSYLSVLETGGFWQLIIFNWQVLSDIIRINKNGFVLGLQLLVVLAGSYIRRRITDEQKSIPRRHLQRLKLA